jgi:hypothetical protein
MVDHIEPVPDIFPVTIDGQRVPFQDIENYKWNELFWELVRAIIV